MDESGKIRFGYVYGKTYREVHEKLLVLKASYNYSEPATVLTLEKVGYEWLAKERMLIKSSTYAKYVYTLKSHILPSLGNEDIRDITSYKLNLFIENKLQNGRIDQKGGLSRKTVHDMYVIIKSILKYAEEEYNTYNCNIQVPILRRKKPHISILDPSDQKKLEEFLLYNSDNPCCLGVLLCLYTGLRLGEICALKWEHINLKTEIIKIESTLQRIQNVDMKNAPRTRVVCGEPKSDSSNREIPIPYFLLELLKQNAPKSYLNSYFLTGNSRFLEPRTYQNRFKKFLKLNQIPPTNFHSLRHTFASRCVMAGVDIKSLSEILGHSNVQITLNYYVHTSIEDKRKQMNLLYHSF